MSHPVGPSAPDSPAVVVTANVQKYAMKKKKILNAEESELYELTQAAGITLDQEVFKIIVDLLKMDVAPQVVLQTLKAMCAGQRVSESCGGDASSVSHGGGIPSTKAEARDEGLSSGKSVKVPAGAPTALGPRATRVNAKMAAYAAQDVGSAPHAQGRGKKPSFPMGCTPGSLPSRELHQLVSSKNIGRRHYAHTQGRAVMAVSQNCRCQWASWERWTCWDQPPQLELDQQGPLLGV
ncbi:mitotic-spindle organizing protein 2 isoform X2 [Corythoichthys intestinalis]|uniref:mitotic-spindle organizing protein 2 isoform X2 n=1 Tax=Corythoichthys intestinalis TaxID=161448 RepID=UPI0025A5F949|nr:mitotic-spindle organizing protein 2 isoform X2 [Corythoichthys intestinalis]